MSIFFNKDTRRRIFQSTLATLNMAEVTKDEHFEKRCKVFQEIMEKYENLHGLLTEYWESVCFSCSAKNKVVTELLKQSSSDNDEDYEALKGKIKDMHNLTNKMIIEGFCVYYKQRVLRPIQDILEQGPKIEEKIKRCRALQIDVDAYSRKAQDARDALDKVSRDDTKRRFKFEETIRSKDKKLKDARAVMNEAKQEFYDDLSEIEMSFPKRMREQLVANLSLQVCMYEQCRDLLQPLTVHVPESGSELLLMSSFCSEKVNEFSRDSKRRRVSESVRSAIPTPSLDDISRHLVAEQWRAGSNGSVAVPFGLPISRKKNEEEEALPIQSKMFTTIDDFENVMKSQRNADASVRQRSKERIRSKSRIPPALPTRGNTNRVPTPKRGGVRLNSSDAKTLARLSDETNRGKKNRERSSSRRRGAPPPIPEIKKDKDDLLTGLFDTDPRGDTGNDTTRNNSDGGKRITSLKYSSDEEEEGLLTPEDSDTDHEEEEEKKEGEEKNVQTTTTVDGIRICLNHEKRKGKYVYDSISCLWYNTKTKYFFNEKTKVYCKNPTDGPFYRYNRELKKLEKLS